MRDFENHAFFALIPARQIVWFAALLGLLFRAEYLVQFSALPNFSVAVGADVVEYYARAQNVLRGLPFPVEADIHAPLYSFFLAAVCRLPGNAVVNARILQTLLNYGAWFALYALLIRRKTPFKIAFAFLSLAMFTPIICFHQAELISETLLLPLTTAALWGFELAEKRKVPRWYLLPGAFCALGVLTHGLMLGFAAAEAAWLLWKKKFARAGFFCLSLAVILTGVILVKSAYYGKLTGIQANSAFNVWLGNNLHSTGGCYLRPGPKWRQEHRLAKSEAQSRDISVNALYWKRIASFWFDHPGKALLLTAKKAAMIFSPQELIAGADPEALIYSTPLQKHLHWMTGEVIFFALCGIFFVIRKRVKGYEHFLLLGTAMLLAQTATVTASRYRIGMMPALLLLGALGVTSFPWKRFWFLPIALLLPFSYTGESGWEEKAAIFGEALLQQGKNDEAEALLLVARPEIKDPARIENLLGILAERRGSLAGAEKHYMLAIAGEPEEPSGYLNLGKICFNAPGKRQLAVRMIAASLERESAQPGAWNYLGIAALERGDFRLAEQYFNTAVELAPDHPGYTRNLQICRRAAKEKMKK